MCVCVCSVLEACVWKVAKILREISLRDEHHDEASISLLNRRSALSSAAPYPGRDWLGLVAPADGRHRCLARSRRHGCLLLRGC